MAVADGAIGGPATGSEGTRGQCVVDVDEARGVNGHVGIDGNNVGRLRAGPAETNRGALSLIVLVTHDLEMGEVTVDGLDGSQRTVSRAIVDEDDFGRLEPPRLEGGGEAGVASGEALGLVVGRNDQ